MKAVVVPRFGDPEVLALDDIPAPVPAPGQVLVRVRAAALQPSDVACRRGNYLGGPAPPFIAGVSGAGERLDTGEPVAFLSGTGAHAEWVAVDARACVAVPAGVSFEAAAAVPVAFAAAHEALAVAAVAAGETVVVTGAAGAVGGAVIQLARLRGARVVALVSSAERRERALALGADTCLEYSQVGAARGKVVGDVLIDVVGGRSVRALARALPVRGRLVVIGFSAGDPVPLDPVALVFGNLTVHGVHVGAAAAADPPRMARTCAELLAGIARGALNAAPGARFPLVRAREAHIQLEARAVVGPAVLVPG